MRFPRSCKIKNYELAKNKDVLKIKDKFNESEQKMFITLPFLKLPFFPK